jgi:splicing factor 1
MYGSSLQAMPPNAQHTYPASSYGYSSYYNAVPPPPPPSAPVHASATDQSQNIGNVPWATAPVPPPASSAEKATYGADAEYEKFMAETK